ncbi:MAG: hypothetical protein ABH889_02450 [Candidatus Portnoybacteria bacterium]
MIQKPIFVQILVLILTVAVSAGLLMYTHILDPVWNPFRLSPEQTLDQMTKKMAEEKTFHGEALLSLSFKNQIDFDFSGELKSDIDLTDQDNLKQANAFSLVLALEGTQYTLDGQSIVIGDDTYFKLNSIPLELNIVFSLFGIDVNNVKDQWIDLGKDSLTKLYERIGLTEEDLETAVEKDKEERSQLMNVLKGALENKDLYSVKEELPNEKAGGKDTYHYLIVLEKDELSEAVAYIFDNSDEKNSVLMPFASLGQARVKAREASLTANMRQLRTAAELIRSEHGTYAKLDCNYPNYGMSDICNGISKQTGSNPVFYAESDSYCAYTPFLNTEDYSYCIDSFGRSYTTKNVKEQGYCNTELLICPPKAEVPDDVIEKIVKEETLKDLNDFLEKVGDITAEVWIGKQDNLLYRIKSEKEIDLNQFGEEGNLVLTLDINFSEFNKPTKVDPPEDSKTIEELFPEETFFSPIMSANMSARDAQRKSSMRQMVTAMELYYGDNNKYLQSRTMPASIGNYMSNIPADPSTEKPYFWLDNTQSAATYCGGGQRFCVWADLEDGGYFVASENGNKEVLDPPVRCPCF